MHFHHTACVLAAAGALACGPALAQSAKAPVVVKIIGFNDYHGNLESPGTFGQNTTVPTAQRPAVGGADALAAMVQRLKEQNPNNVVVGAGDFIGASPLISALFFDEPAVETLNLIGLEFNAVGNHEFDRGSAELRRLQDGGCKVVGGVPDPNSCRGFGSVTPGSFDGAKFHWLSANVLQNKNGNPLLKAYGIKGFDGGVRVAFIGMTLKGTPTIVTPTGVAGLSFEDEADTVNALIPKIRRKGIEAVVVLVHQGGFQNGAGNANDINGCLGDLKNSDASDSEIRNLVARFDDAVDLVITGHTHAAYNCSANTTDVTGTIVSGPTVTQRSTGLPNAVGRKIPVTSASAFGRVLTDVDLTIDRRTGHVLAVSPVNRLVDRSDPDIQQRIAEGKVKPVVEAYKAAVSPLANQVIGTITAPLPNSGEEMLAGDLIADAQLAATQPDTLGGAVMAFMNPGGVRSPGFAFAGAAYPYDVTYGNGFTVQPFGNSLVTMTLSTQQIKDLLEQQFAGCKGQTANRILQISNGLKYSYSAAAPACAKVMDLWFTPTDTTVVPPVATGAPEQLVQAGLVLNPAKSWRVTVNNFIATGGDNFTTLLGGTTALGGAQDIDALVAYLGGYKAPAAAYDPGSAALGIPRVTRLP